MQRPPEEGRLDVLKYAGDLRDSEFLDRVSFLANEHLSSRLTADEISASRYPDRCVHRPTEMMVRIQDLPPTFISPLLLFFCLVQIEADFHFSRSIDPPVVHTLSSSLPMLPLLLAWIARDPSTQEGLADQLCFGPTLSPNYQERDMGPNWRCIFCALASSANSMKYLRIKKKTLAVLISELHLLKLQKSSSFFPRDFPLLPTTISFQTSELYSHLLVVCRYRHINTHFADFPCFSSCLVSPLGSFGHLHDVDGPDRPFWQTNTPLSATSMKEYNVHRTSHP